MWHLVPLCLSVRSFVFPRRPPSMLHNRFFLLWAVCYRPLAFPPTFNICCLRFSAVGGSTRSLDARSWSNPKPFSASNTTPGPTARPLGVPLAALVPSDPETFQNTSHFHPVTQHNGFLEKLCCSSFLLLWWLCCVTGTPPAAVSGPLNFRGALSDPRAGRGQDVQKAGAMHRHGTGAASRTQGGRLSLE